MDKTGKFGIGHVFIEVSCDTRSGQKETLFTGMTSRGTDEERDLILNQGYGMGVLLHSYKGKMQAHNFVKNWLKLVGRMSRTRGLTYLVNNKSCQRMLEWAHEFYRWGHSQVYGLFNRPRYGEGAGCSRFAVSFMDVAGLLTDEHTKNWRRIINIPASTVGGPLTNNVINIWDAFEDFPTSWAKSDEPHFQIEFWDPDLMALWVDQKYEDWKQNSFLGLQTFKLGSSKNIIIDKRYVPTPNEPLFLEYTDEDYAAPSNPNQLIY